MNTLREEAIVQLIKHRLSCDRRTGGQTIDVIVENGNIFLVGACDNAETKEVARTIVSGIYGVIDVVDQLQIRSKQTAANV